MRQGSDRRLTIRHNAQLRRDSCTGRAMRPPIPQPAIDRLEPRLMLSAAPVLVEPSGPRFAAYEVHGRIGNRALSGDWEMGLTDNTNQPPEASGQFAWVNGAAVPFALSVTANHAATFTLGGRSITYDYGTLASMDLSAVFIWAKATKTSSSVTLGNLALDGEAVSGQVLGVGSGTQFDEAWVVGGDMSDGFTLTGDVTFTWSSSYMPNGSHLQFHLQPGRTAAFDLDIDSDNDGIIAGNDSQGCQPAEDQIEENAPGKMVAVNDDDSDDDGLVDYYDYDPTDGDLGAESQQFVPLTITLPTEVDPSITKLRLTYSQSAPPVAPTPTDPLPGTGHLRIWRVNGNVVRNPEAISLEGSGDFVESGESYTPAQFNYDATTRTIQLWVEAVSVDHAVSHEIVLSVDPGGTGAFRTADSVAVTSMNTELYHLVDDVLTKADAMTVSHPGPVFAGVSMSVGDLRAGMDGVSILGDITIAGTLDDAAMDLAEGIMGSLPAIGVFVNGSTEAENVVELSQTKAADPNVFSLTKPYDFSASFSEVLEGVSLEPGTNFITLRAMNTYGITGFYEQSFDVVVHEPETAPVQVRVTGLGASELLLQYRRYDSDDWGPTLAFYCDEPDHTVYRDGDGVAVVTITQMPEFDGETGQLVTPASAMVAISSIGVLPEAVVFDVVDGEYLSGNDVAAMNEESVQELATYEGFTFTCTMDPTCRASQGGELDPFFIGMQNSRHDPSALPVTDVLFKGKYYSAVVYDDKWFVGTPGFAVPRPFLAVLGRLPQQPQPSLAEPLVSQPSPGLAASATELPVSAPAVTSPALVAGAQQTGTFIEGFGQGLLDTGGDLVDGLKAAGEGIWYLAKNYNTFSCLWRMGTTGSSILVEDQKRIEVVAKVAEQLASVMARVIADDAKLIHAACVGDDATVNEISDTYREVFELAVDMLKDVYKAVKEGIAGISEYDVGKVVGRIAGEVLIQVLPAILTAGASAAVTLPAKAAIITAEFATKLKTVIKAADVAGVVFRRVWDFANLIGSAATLAEELVKLIDVAGEGGGGAAAAAMTGGYDVLASAPPIAVAFPSEGPLPQTTSFAAGAAATTAAIPLGKMFRLVERWALLISKIAAANPGAGTKAVFAKVLQESKAFAKDMDECLGGVTRYFNKKMWKEAADAGGDYSKVMTYAELGELGVADFAFGSKTGRFAAREMWKHHTGVQAWAKEYLKAANPGKYGEWALDDARWKPIMDSMPSLPLPMRQHTVGDAAFHRILGNPSQVRQIERASKILERLADAYAKWDAVLPNVEKGLGANIWVVSRKWLEDMAR